MMTDDEMADLVTKLRNETQLSRFNRAEVATVLRYLEANGYLAGKRK